MEGEGVLWTKKTTAQTPHPTRHVVTVPSASPPRMVSRVCLDQGCCRTKLMERVACGSSRTVVTCIDGSHCRVPSRHDEDTTRDKTWIVTPTQAHTHTRAWNVSETALAPPFAHIYCLITSQVGRLCVTGIRMNLIGPHRVTALPLCTSRLRHDAAMWAVSAGHAPGLQRSSFASDWSPRAVDASDANHHSGKSSCLKS
uniref:Uncharacterized protein n=1 Tax=Mesocestoides corti TaxID=53468 RepID=A0A5K3FHS4_MESCO